MRKHKLNTAGLLWKALKEMVKDRYDNIAPSLAYYQFLSLAPLIGFSIYISNKILGAETTKGTVKPFLEYYFTPQFVKVIVFFLARSKHMEPGSLFTLSLLSGLTLAYSTKGYFGMVKDTIEITWNIRTDVVGIMAFLKRLRDDILVTAGALLVIIFFVIIGSVFLHGTALHIVSLNTKERDITYGFNLVFEIIFFFCLLYFYFLFLPPVKVPWKWALLPAAVGALLQVIGRAVMKVYMFNYPDAGLAESFLMVLLWFYYSNMAFIYAAELAKVTVLNKQDVYHQQ